MSKQKRYVVTTQYYLYCDNDEEAVNKAKSDAFTQDNIYDDKCSITTIVEQPPGTIGNRPVYPKKHKP